MQKDTSIYGHNFKKKLGVYDYYIEHNLKTIIEKKKNRTYQKHI